ncbi:MAG: hypothetical protein KBD63_02300 [Bacteriovoracaceae bacterium]|nr:hypothetical protein [Bacteriovoracaceae bacterium]
MKKTISLHALIFGLLLLIGCGKPNDNGVNNYTFSDGATASSYGINQFLAQKFDLILKAMPQPTCTDGFQGVRLHFRIVAGSQTEFVQGGSAEATFNLPPNNIMLGGNSSGTAVMYFAYNNNDQHLVVRYCPSLMYEGQLLYYTLRNTAANNYPSATMQAFPQQYTGNFACPRALFGNIMMRVNPNNNYSQIPLNVNQVFIQLDSSIQPSC